MTENYPSLAKGINIQNQEVGQIPNRINSEKFTQKRMVFQHLKLTKKTF